METTVDFGRVSRRQGRHAVLPIGLLMLVPLLPAWTGAAPAFGFEARPLEVTRTAGGQRIVASAVEQLRLVRPNAASEVLRVWELMPGEWLIGEALPENLRVEPVIGPDGPTADISFTVGRSLPVTPPDPAPAVASASGPSWIWLEQRCFARLSSLYGWLLPCYVEHGMVNEADPRDFYQLEQYGTVAATLYGRIYNGWLAAVRASDSAPMSWIDWSPRGSLSGSCTTVSLSVSALGVGISSSGVMCEHWYIYLYEDAGHFKEQWDCGCIYPFGLLYPNSREIDYMQAVSVPNRGVPRWTLSAGFLAH